MSTKVAINGLGRIGRAILKLVIDEPSIELVAVNDLVEVENLAYLLRFDTVYGRYSKPVVVDGDDLVVAGRKLRTLSNRDPLDLPWKELGVELVFECTGALTRREDLEKHVRAGARFVLLSAPSKDEEVETVIHGVNVPGGTPAIISCASCTTNCITPIVEVIGRRIGIREGGDDDRARLYLVPIDRRRTEQAFPPRSGRGSEPRAGHDGRRTRDDACAASNTRVCSTASRSGADSCRIDRGHHVRHFAKDDRRRGEPDPHGRSRHARYAGVLGVSRDPLVSSDIVGDPRASIVDLELTKVIDGDLVKVMSWYDNEWGYANQMLREARSVAGGFELAEADARSRRRSTVAVTVRKSKGSRNNKATKTEIKLEVTGVHLWGWGWRLTQLMPAQGVEGACSRCDMKNGTITVMASDAPGSEYRAFDALGIFAGFVR